jgi:hypothetical protein
LLLPLLLLPLLLLPLLLLPLLLPLPPPPPPTRRMKACILSTCYKTFFLQYPCGLFVNS